MQYHYEFTLGFLVIVLLLILIYIYFSASTRKGCIKSKRNYANNLVKGFEALDRIEPFIKCLEKLVAEYHNDWWTHEKTGTWELYHNAEYKLCLRMSEDWNNNREIKAQFILSEHAKGLMHGDTIESASMKNTLLMYRYIMKACRSGKFQKCIDINLETQKLLFSLLEKNNLKKKEYAIDLVKAFEKLERIEPCIRSLEGIVTKYCAPHIRPHEIVMDNVYTNSKHTLWIHTAKPDLEENERKTKFLFCRNGASPIITIDNASLEEKLLMYHYIMKACQSGRLQKYISMDRDIKKYLFDLVIN